MNYGMIDDDNDNNTVVIHEKSASKQSKGKNFMFGDKDEEKEE